MSSDADTSSSSSVDDLDVRPSPFSRVPAEIKALIAAEAARQHLAYKQRLKKILGVTQHQVAKSGARDWEGKSVNALFCLSREWSALAAPYVFKNITSKRRGDSLFTLGIANRYAKLVEEVILEPNEHSATLLSKLPAFINLRRISIAGTALSTLFGVHDLGDDDEDDPTVEQALHRAALKSVITRVPEVSLPGVCLDQLLWILPALGHVKRLSISCYVYDNAPKIASVRQQLSRLSQFEHLAFTGLTVDASRLIDEPSTTWAFGATLKSLKVALAVNTSLWENGWRFIESCSPSLERLDLRTVSTELAEALSGRAEGGSKASFPALKHLRLDATKEDSPHFLSLLAASPIRTLSISLFGLVYDRIDPPLHSLLQQSIDLFSDTLQVIELCVSSPYEPCAYVSPAVHAELVTLASTHGIALTAGPRYDAFLHPPKTNNPTYISSACDAADDALRFGLARSARLRQTEDVDGVKALLGLLEPLKGEMMREKD